MSALQSGRDLGMRLDGILSCGTLTEDDVAFIRRAVWSDDSISLAEADQLFAVDKLTYKPESWFNLFIEAISDYLVNQTMPHGYIDTANAMWLMARIDHDGVVESRSELELLLRVMKIADNITDRLEIYALNQVVRAVVTGRGRAACDREAPLGIMTKADVDLLRRVLYAASSKGGIGITKCEAQTLFDINDTFGNGPHHASWQALFVGAIANHLMCLAAWEEPDMQEALRRENFLKARGKGFIIPSMDFGTLVGGLKNLFEKSDTTDANADLRLSAERVDAAEAFWLTERLNQDGILNDNEKAVLQFLENESPDIHAALMPYIKAA